MFCRSTLITLNVSQIANPNVATASVLNVEADVDYKGVRVAQVREPSSQVYHPPSPPSLGS